MYNNINQMIPGKRCSNQIGQTFGVNRGGFFKQEETRGKAIKLAENIFNDFISQYTQGELRDAYKSLSDHNAFRAFIAVYLNNEAVGNTPQCLTYHDLQQIIVEVVQKRLMRFSFTVGFNKPEWLFAAWKLQLDNMPSHKRAELRTILADIRDTGYIKPENYTAYEDKLSPLQKVCEIAETLEISEGLLEFEISGAAIHAYFKYVSLPNKELKVFERPTVKEHDVPVNGYNEIVSEQTRVTDCQDTRQAILVDVLTKLNPAERFQVFKFAAVAHKTPPEKYMDWHLAGIPVTTGMFPDEDVTVMKEAITKVTDAYMGTFAEEFMMGHLLHLVTMIWSERNRFYIYTDFAWVDKVGRADTSFTETILAGVDEEPNLTGILNITDIPQTNHCLTAAHIQGATGDMGRAGMTVASPGELLGKLEHIRNNAVQKAIDEINSILDDEERVSSLASYDLTRGKVILELKLENSLGGILAEVLGAVEKAGWAVSSSVDGTLRLEASQPLK